MRQTPPQTNLFAHTVIILTAKMLFKRNNNSIFMASLLAESNNMKENRRYRSTAQAIIKMIDAENYSVGMRLPAERELAERFNVSRVVIREAGIYLDAMGIIEVKGGSGAYVCEKPLSKLSHVTAFGLTQTRLLFESECAALAATKATDAQISEIEATVDLMANTPSDSPEGHQADHAFHLLIAKATGNEANVIILQNIWHMRNEIDAVKRVYMAVGEKSSADRVKEHLNIMKAIRDRNPAAARQAMRQHFLRLLNALLDYSEHEAIEEARRQSKSIRELYLHHSID